MNVYEDITEGLNEAIEYEKGKGKARTVKLTEAPTPDLSTEEQMQSTTYTVKEKT